MHEKAICEQVFSQFFKKNVKRGLREAFLHRRFKKIIKNQLARLKSSSFVDLKGKTAFFALEKVE